MKARAARLVRSLEQREHEEGLARTGPPIEVVRAPGRVNLIGEHTDYNDGFALPAAIDLEIWLALRPWDEPRVELTSLDLGETAGFRFDHLAPRAGRDGSWIDYVAGTAWAAREAGHPVRGFRGVLDSTLPIGASLSSSAAIEMAAAQALLGGLAANLGPGILATIGRRCENEYIGISTGIMDQFSSAAGKSGHAILLDCRSLDYRHVPLPDEVAIVACHTGSSRKLRGSQYQERWADCMEGVRILAEREPAVRALRDVDESMLTRHRAQLPDRVWRRCRCIVNENARVQSTVAALEAGDLEAIGGLFAASHADLRDLYEIVSPELDAMVAIAQSVPGVVGTRMTGGGFGGCTVNLVRRDAVAALEEAVFRDYPAMTGLTPRVYVTKAVDGAGAVPLG
jgi:galactokinase